MCLPVLIHKLADKQEDKLQDGSPVSASYVKNGFLNHRKEYYTKLLSGEKGGPACGWWIVDSLCVNKGKHACVLRLKSDSLHSTGGL